jgi:hypothetical protein
MSERQYDVLPDGRLDPDQPGVDALLEDVLDNFSDAARGIAWNEPPPTDLDRLEREGEMWRAALHTRLRRALASDGITVARVGRTLDRDFAVNAHDTSRPYRDYSVDVSVGEALSMTELHRDEPLDAVTRMCAERIRGARRTYERRVSEAEADLSARSR